MRIITYNTRGSLGMDGVRSTARIADVLRVLTPDILCFQEIHKGTLQSGREDQPAVLSALLSRPFLFQSNLRIGLGSYGVGIATRGQFASRTEHFLPGGKEQRGALEVQLRDIGGFRRLTIFCTHWGLESGERMEQAQELARLVNAAPRPVIICGDLNEASDGAAIRHLLSTTGLMDADATQNRPTFDADNPTIRIDYCLYSSELKLTHLEVLSTYASDHLPVLADFEKA
jgi:endonuclease/exonuclease/phosphatase family metal-dependent hydrolase